MTTCGVNDLRLAPWQSLAIGPMNATDIVNNALLRLGSCCETWAQARTVGTDNEGYEKLIGLNDDHEPVIGCRPDGKGFVVKFCPWCGSPK